MHWCFCPSRIMLFLPGWKAQPGRLSHSLIVGHCLSEFADAPSAMRVNKDQLQAKLSAAFGAYENEATQG